MCPLLLQPAQETATAQASATQEIDDDPAPELVDTEMSDMSDSSLKSDSDDDDLAIWGGDDHLDDEEDQNDFMTDEEAEVASDREETVLSWPHPKTCEKDKKVHPLLEE